MFQENYQKHTEKMLYDPNGIASFAELDLVYQTQGNFAWGGTINCPDMEFLLRYLDLGKPKNFRNGFSIAPYMDFGFLQHRTYSIHF